MLRRFIDTVVDIVCPKTCVACKNTVLDISSIDDIVCFKCWGDIKRNLPPFCHSCGRHLNVNNFTKHICPVCIKKSLHFDRAFSPCVYTGVVKELIHEFKYKSKDYLGPTLSRFLTEFIREYNLPMDFIDFIVPIPLHKARLREREFNQAQILGLFIATEFNKDLLNDTLRRHRPTQTQTELEDNLRFLNVKDSFSITRKETIKGKNILLIDDVMTTGATCSEAAYTLKNAGVNIVFVLTLAN